MMVQGMSITRITKHQRFEKQRRRTSVRSPETVEGIVAGQSSPITAKTYFAPWGHLTQFGLPGTGQDCWVWIDQVTIMALVADGPDNLRWVRSQRRSNGASSARSIDEILEPLREVFQEVQECWPCCCTVDAFSFEATALHDACNAIRERRASLGLALLDLPERIQTSIEAARCVEAEVVCSLWLMSFVEHSSFVSLLEHLRMMTADTGR